MCLVDDYYISAFANTFKVRFKFPAHEIGVIENLKLVVFSEDVRKILFEGCFPNRFASGFWDEQGDVKSVMQNQSLDQHHSNKCLSQTDSVTQKCAVITFGAFQ